MDPFKQPHVAFLTFTLMAGEKIEVFGVGGGGEMCEDISCGSTK